MALLGMYIKPDGRPQRYKWTSVRKLMDVHRGTDGRPYES